MSGFVNSSSGGGGGGDITGSGTIYHLAMFTSSTSIGDSVVRWNGLTIYVGSGAYFSVPGGNTLYHAEQFGAYARAVSVDDLAIGYNSYAYGIDYPPVGLGGAIAIGANAEARGSGTIVIGHGASTGSLGSLIPRLLIGGEDPVREVYIGSTTIQHAPWFIDLSLQPTGTGGTNQVGNNFKINGGGGSGNAGGGSLSFGICEKTSSGTDTPAPTPDILKFTSDGNIVFTPIVANATNASPGGVWKLVGGAHTSLPLSTEVHDFNLALNRTVQFSTGALTTQRAAIVKAPTYSFVGASTIADASTFYIDGAPVAGTNATITNSWALFVNGATKIVGKLTVTGALDPTSVLLSDPAAGTALFYESNNGATAPVSGAATGRIRYNNAGAGTWQISTQAGAYVDIATGTGSIGGTGTTNKIAKFSAATTIADSSISDDGTNVDIATKFTISVATGNITKINNVTTSFPSSQGAANTFLGNNGSGTLTWSAVGLTTGVTGVLPIANGGTNSSAALSSNRLITSVGGAIVELGAMSNGQLVVGSTGAAPQVVTLSGDATINNTGALTIASGAITDAKTDTTTPANFVIRAIGIMIDGGGAVITTGQKAYVEVPYACTIIAARIFSTTSGSIVVDIWKDTYANFPPTVADTITASAKPTLSSATKNQDTTLTGWTVTVAKGDILMFNVDSASTVTQVLVELTVKTRV